MAISVVSIAELVGGMLGERREVWRLLASFRAEPATEIVAHRAGDCGASIDVATRASA